MRQFTEVQRDTVMSSTWWFDILDADGNWITSVERNTQNECEATKAELIEQESA